jgi:diguanylate cyclase (GGDEF)-like protein
MNAPRMPRQILEPEETPSASGRRLLYEQALRASEQLQSPEGNVAMVLLDIALARGSGHLSERVLKPVTSKLAALLNRRLRSIDVLARTADTELVALLAMADLGVAAAFSERLRQPIERALSEMDLADDIVVCMGLAANPNATRWRPESLIELADFRMRAARQQATDAATRAWALSVDGCSIPEEWVDSEGWPAISEITSHSSL